MENNINEIRQSKNITQSELANMTGKNNSTLCMWETGERKPPANVLVPIADALGCTVDELLRRET